MCIHCVSDTLLHLPTCPCLCMHAKLLQSCPVYSLRSYGLWPARFLCPWDSPGKNTEVGCCALLQGIFLTQGSKPPLLGLLYWQVNFLPLVPPGKPPNYHNIVNWLYPNTKSEKAMAIHSSTLAWKIPWMEEPGRLQSMGSLRVGHNWAT